MVLCCAALVGGLRWFFGATIQGKALRATASDRLGARLVGIDAGAAGALAFGLASFIAALAGVLIGAVTPLSYDAGFDIGLKGFVAAIMGGLMSYPMAAAGAVLVGVLEFAGQFLGQRLSRGHRLHPADPGAGLAVAAQGLARGPRMTNRVLPLAALIVAVFVAPALLPAFYVTLFGYVGLATLVALGLVLLTGISGQTSFGQASFVGLAAYATTIAHPVSRARRRWLGLAPGLCVTGGVAWLLGLITARLSGHFLALVSVAWGISFFSLFGTLPCLHGFNGIGDIPPLRHRAAVRREPAGQPRRHLGCRPRRSWRFRRICSTAASGGRSAP